MIGVLSFINFHIFYFHPKPYFIQPNGVGIIYDGI